MSRRASHTSFCISVLLSKKISGIRLSKSIDFRSVNRYERFFVDRRVKKDDGSATLRRLDACRARNRHSRYVGSRCACAITGSEEPD